MNYGVGCKVNVDYGLKRAGLSDHMQMAATIANLTCKNWLGI
jgi:hypothetical protein